MTLHRQKRAFTLIELMVVVGLIGLIMMFAIPAFQGADQGGRVRAAIFQLNMTLGLARQTAITSRQDVHILFPDFNLSYTAETIPYAYSAYAVYGVRDGYIGEWRKLPQGVIFDSSYKSPNESGIGIRNIFLQSSTYEKRVPFPFNNDATNSILALTYRPDGAIDHAGINSRAVFLVEGWVDYSPTYQNVQPTNRPNATTFGLEIRPESGQTRMREYNR